MAVMPEKELQFRCGHSEFVEVPGNNNLFESFKTNLTGSNKRKVVGPCRSCKQAEEQNRQQLEPLPAGRGQWAVPPPQGFRETLEVLLFGEDQLSVDALRGATKRGRPSLMQA